jgi:hypothetical protein
METISSFKKLFTIDYWQSKTKLQCETKMPTTTTKMHHEYNKVIPFVWLSYHINLNNIQIQSHVREILLSCLDVNTLLPNQHFKILFRFHFKLSLLHL